MKTPKEYVAELWIKESELNRAGKFVDKMELAAAMVAKAMLAAEQRGIEKGRNEGERYIYGIGAILALSPDLSVGETYRTIKVALTGALATEDGRKAAIYLMDEEAKALAS